MRAEEVGHVSGPVQGQFGQQRQPSLAKHAPCTSDPRVAIRGWSQAPGQQRRDDLVQRRNGEAGAGEPGGVHC